MWEDDIKEICRSLERQKYHAVCLNDSKTEIDFENIRQALTKSFERILSVPSEFEQNM